MDNKVIQLLNGGDWACVYRESESLVRACGGLAELVDGDLAVSAREIAELADSDMTLAIRRWGELATRVRFPTRRASPRARGSGCYRTAYLRLARLG